jgi:hypothetical protein
MTWAAVAVGVGGAVIGGMNAADAADKASEAQISSTREAGALQRQMFEEGRADQAPWLQRGNAAGNLLSYYLGIDPLGAGNPARITDGSATNDYGLGPAPTIEQFTTRPMTPVTTYGPPSGGDQGANGTMAMVPYQQMAPGSPVVDQAGFHAAMSDYQTKLQAAKAAAAADPRFGSLLKPFTGESLATDPGYQFGVHQGEESITNNRAALGSLLSGATLTDLTKFGNDYGGTKFNEGFSRNQADKQLAFNMLSGVSGTGQATANSIANQGNAYGAAAGGLITDSGNARASGYIGGANALNSMIGSSVNQYNSANLLKSLNNSPGRTAPQTVYLGGSYTTNPNDAVV